ncbi:MAG TPA: VOC family protein [Candidatus Saccharimonadales bacterium]|nr:VOC family protein [Candidatus Saccharimonadales bacterium]
MGRVVHFEITADDLERAKKFYGIFGWEIKDAGMPGAEYWLATTGKDGMGIDGAIMPRSYSPQPIINTISVDNLDEMMEKVKASGGKIDGERQTIPGVGDFCYAFDTEGNRFGMLQPLPRAS